MKHEAARRPARWWPAWGRRAAALAAIFALLLLGLWIQRKPIARDFIDRSLRMRGVPARYVIEDLGPRRQRLTGLVIGDQAAPDLTADLVELRIGYGFGWPSLQSVTARGVRVRGRVVNGTLSLGSLDRLLPAPSGKPFTLPDLRVDLADTRLRLEAPVGAVMLAVAGQGNLSNGFVGRMTAGAPRLASGGCIALRPAARLAIRIADRQPTLSGPIAADRIECAGVTVQRARADVKMVLAEALTPLSLGATLVSGTIMRGAQRAEALAGRIDYDGRDLRNRNGRVNLAARGVRMADGSAQSATLGGRYRLGDTVPTGGGSARPVRFAGTVALAGASVAPSRLAGVERAARSAADTPVAPLAAALVEAAGRAGRDFDLRSALSFDGDLIGGRGGPVIGEVRLGQLEIGSRSGARLRIEAGKAAALRVETGALSLDGIAELAGGGFPAARLTLRQATPDTPLSGEAIVVPYAAKDARLALAPVRFTQGPAGAWLVRTTATLDGPLGDGRVTGLSLPIDASIGKVLTINPACVPLHFTSLAIAGVVLGETRLPLCPVGGAMLRIARAGASGGMAVPRPRLSGRVGSQPLWIGAADLRVDIGRPGFVANALAVRLGAGAAPTALDIVKLDGRIDGAGVGGGFAGAAGRIANVPLLLSGGEGRWRLAGGRLGLGGVLTVADADPNPRFNPLVSQDVTLGLVGGVIRASGTLREPKSGLAISAVTLTHDLSAGRGGAVLDVPGITFGPAFQPDSLTRLTLGVVANVAGTARGRGTIAWGPKGVTSEGDFATDGTDLAAVFGPVSGIKGSIHFSDLLGLTTPPGQLVTVSAFNPGIAVEGGVIGYQLLPAQKVAVGGGKWPFSGGALILEPTILDFGQPVERRMTFRVEGMQAGVFLQKFDFRNIAVTGTFDGTLPMIFDEKGGRIEGGRLVVRKGGGTLAYIGELTNKDLGTFGKLAFDALKSMRYANLAIELNGALDSEIVSRIVFTGTNENPAPDKKAKGLLKNLTGLPFKFNIVIRAPFRGLTNSAEAFVNPRGLIGNAAKPATPPVQPPLSEDKR